LSEPKKFLEKLLKYDRDNIPDALIVKVKPMMEREDMTE
jgi:hypothetical protein